MKVKRGRFGEVKWTAMGMHMNATGKYENRGYVMVVDASRWNFKTTEHAIEVLGNAKSKDWKVALFGEIVATVDTKSEAQRLALELVDQDV